MRTVNFLTDQEIFDRAVAHLYGQRCAALLPKGGAAYRGSCGGCPIGSVIRPADYASAMEGVPVRYLRGPALGPALIHGRGYRRTAQGIAASQDQRLR
jgi:hypothetical protein